MSEVMAGWLWEGQNVDGLRGGHTDGGLSVMGGLA